MASILFLVHPSRADAHELASRTEHWLGQLGHTCQVLRLAPPSSVFDGERDTPLDHVDLAGCDLAVSVGGDGTFLRLIPLAATAQVPVMGVNFGHLGYLLEVAPDGLQDALERFLSGLVRLEERILLTATVRGPYQQSLRHPPAWLALNEVVVEKTLPGHTVHLRTLIDGQPLEDVRADGLLVATPSGSTAYNLSASGPVLAPTLRVMVVTPIAPHRSMGRSLVLEDSRMVTLEVLGERPAALVVDGQQVGHLPPGCAVDCGVAPLAIRLVTLGRRSLARALGPVLQSGGPD